MEKKKEKIIKLLNFQLYQYIIKIYQDKICYYFYFLFLFFRLYLVSEKYKKKEKNAKKYDFFMFGYPIKYSKKKNKYN